MYSNNQYLPKDFQNKLNLLGSQRKPFLFIIDFEAKKPLVLDLNKINPLDISYDFLSSSNVKSNNFTKKIIWNTTFPNFDLYKNKFQKVMEEIIYGNSFLLNLTDEVEINTANKLIDFYENATSPFKIFLKGQFVSYSPEIFVRIIENKIITYPMKGTIDANIQNASNLLLNDTKELAEHYTIVDLMRNDLSMVSENVEVVKYRYIDRIDSKNGSILQTSSEIQGLLNPDWNQSIGDIFNALLPAGSISGAPKPKTLEIIKKVEQKDRGYYCGVAGIFNGYSLDSCVLIRFLEERNGRFYYRTGGGITYQSEAIKEYEELKSKVYVPINREF